MSALPTVVGPVGLAKTAARVAAIPAAATELAIEMLQRFRRARDEAGWNWYEPDMERYPLSTALGSAPGALAGEVVGVIDDVRDRVQPGPSMKGPRPKAKPDNRQRKGRDRRGNRLDRTPRREQNDE